MISGVLSSEETIELGRQGENKATQLEFVLTDIKAKYGMGTPVLVHKRPGDDRPHIVQTTFDSASCKLTWIVLDSETLNSGTGQAEIRWLVNDSRVTDLLAKSVVFNTTITSSLMDETTEVPGSIVYLSGTSADWTNRLAGVEQCDKALVLSATYSNPMYADIDETAFRYSGNKGYKYTFKLTDISLMSGSTVDFTMYLKNGNTTVGTFNVTAAGTEFSIIAASDFDGCNIIPHVNVNSISYEWYQTAPIVLRIEAIENALNL